MARRGILPLFGCLMGMETMLNVTQSINTGQLLGGLSELIDNLTEREKQAQAQQSASLRSLNEITTCFNKSTELFQKCTTSAETLLFSLQDVQAKIVQVPASTPRSISSATSRSKESPVSLLDRMGTFSCPYGVLTMTEKGSSFNGTGQEARHLANLVLLSPKVGVYQDLLNKDLEKLISHMDANPQLLKILKEGTREDRKNMYEDIMERIPDAHYQWTSILS